MRWLVAIAIAVVPAAASAQESSKTPRDANAAIQRGLVFLVKDALAWKKEHNCVSCHHAALVVWAMQEAKQRGHAVDVPVLNELTKWLAESGDGKFGMARPATAPEAFSPRAMWFSLALVSAPQPDESSQKGLKLLLKTMAGEQSKSGSWMPWPETRPPLFGSSTESMTALSALAVLPTAAAGDDTAKTVRDKAVKWLEGTKSDGDPQSVAMRLVLWKKLVRPAREWQPLVKTIQERQNADGGWSQAKDMPSDAWATGQALYALAHGGLPPDDPALARGQSFLVKTQRPDGGWPMASRPTVPGGKGSQSLIPITGAGSAWGVIGLARSAETIVERKTLQKD